MGALTIPGRIQDALAFQQSQLGQADPLQGDNNGIPVTPPPVIPQAVPPPTPQAAPAQKKRSLMGRIFGGQDVTASGVGVDAQGNPIPVTGHSSIPGFLSVFPAIRAVAQRSAQQQIQPQEAALAAQQMKAAQAQARAKADLEESDAMKSRIFKGPDGLHIFDPQTNTLKPFMLYKDYQDSNTKAMVEMMMGKPGSDGSDSAIPNLNPIEKGKLLLAVQQASVTQDPDEAHKILFGAAQGILDDRNKSKDIPLGPKIALFQKRLDDQFSVAFPGKPTPQQYVLPPNATEKDFNLADASLKTFVASSDLQQNRLAARQQASATFAAAQAQRGMTNEMARERLALAKTAAGEIDLSPDAQLLVDQIGQGKVNPGRMSYLLARSPGLMESVSRKYPDFDTSKIQAYTDTYRNFTTGKVSVQLNSGATAIRHLAQLKQINDADPVSARIPGTAPNKAYNNLLDTVADELSTFYGEPKTNEAINSKKATLGSLANRDAAIQEQAIAMGVKFDELENTWKNAAPSASYQAPMPAYSEAAKKARAFLDPNYQYEPSQGRLAIPGRQSGTTRIKASDGSLHDVPTANLSKAKQIDPGLQVVTQ